MALDALGAALYYLFFLLGAVSIGGIALRLGNFPLPQDENARLGYGAVAGIALTVFAALADLVLNNSGFATATGLFPILLTLSLVLATGLLAAVFKPIPVPAATKQVAIKQEKTIEIERSTIIMAATAEREDEPVEEKVSITHGVERMRKPGTTEKKKAVLPPPPKPPIEKKPELAQTKPAPTPQKPAVRLDAPPKPPARQEVPPWVKQAEPTTPRQPPRVITPPPVEKIEPESRHPRRIYLHKDDNRPAQLIESKPPAELSSRQTEKEEIEEVARDARELSRFEQHKKQLEERKKTEAPKTTAKTEDKPRKEPAEKSVSMNDLFGDAGKDTAKPSGVFAQLDSGSSGGDLFSQLNAMDAGKPAAGKQETKPAGIGIEKGRCPNCNAATTRIVFCPHCGNAMCASCASSISPSPDGFEYVCPHCGEKVTVKKKKA